MRESAGLSRLSSKQVERLLTWVEASPHTPGYHLYGEW